MYERVGFENMEIFKSRLIRIFAYRYLAGARNGTILFIRGVENGTKNNPRGKTGYPIERTREYF